jgi:signal transduction histidine kinase
VDATPDAYQPPLTVWSHVWRLLAAAFISVLAWFNLAGPQWQEHRALFWFDVGLGAVSFLLVSFRRRWPLTVALVLAVVSAFSGVSAGPATLAAVSLATRRRLGQVLLVGVVSLVAAQAFVAFQPLPQNDPYIVMLTINVSVIAAALATGMYIGSHRELMWTLRERATRAESEQELRVAQARSQERAVIAREMHDVLAHRISQVSMHAGALAFRDDLTAEQVRESATVIQQKSHEALTDLRQVLGVLRGGGDGVLDAPQPTFVDVPELVRETQESGMRVSYACSVPSPAVVPERAGRTVYRIVQEGLTNARKHAPGTTVSVRVGGSPTEGIEVSLSNPEPVGDGRHLATPGAGLGLIGLAERTELVGGRLTHRRTRSGFALHAWIPWAP